METEKFLFKILCFERYGWDDAIFERQSASTLISLKNYFAAQAATKQKNHD
jgi:hypothetical protein